MKVVFQPSRLSGAYLLLVSGRVVPGGQGFIMLTLMSRDQPTLVPVLQAVGVPRATRRSAVMALATAMRRRWVGDGW